MQGAGFRVQGAGCRVQGSGFRVQGIPCCTLAQSSATCFSHRQRARHVSHTQVVPSAWQVSGGGAVRYLGFTDTQRLKQGLIASAPSTSQTLETQVVVWEWVLGACQSLWADQSSALPPTPMKAAVTHPCVSGFMAHVHDSWFRVQGSWFAVQSSRFRCQDSCFKVHGSWSRVQGAGCRG